MNTATPYVQARDAVDQMHARMVDAEEERDEIVKTLRLINGEACGADVHLAMDNIRRFVTQALKAYENRRQSA